MASNNFGPMSNMFSTHLILICFFEQLKFVFFNAFIEFFFIVDQLFLYSTNTLDFTK